MKVSTTPLGTSCPHCGLVNTKILIIGELPSERTEETVAIPGATITVITGVTLGACDDCRNTWFLAKA